MKTPQQRSERYERDRREASERHQRKLDQRVRPEKQEPLEEHEGDLGSEDR